MIHLIRRLPVTLAIALFLSSASVVAGPAVPASASHIVCSQNYFPTGLWVPDQGSWYFAARNEVTCTGTPDYIAVGVQLSVSSNGVPGAILAQQLEVCFGTSSCTAITNLFGPYGRGTWAHARGAFEYPDGHGNTVTTPFDSSPWNCQQFNDPGPFSPGGA